MNIKEKKLYSTAKQVTFSEGKEGTLSCSSWWEE